MQSPIYLQVLLIGPQAPNVSRLTEESTLAAHPPPPPQHTHIPHTQQPQPKLLVSHDNLTYKVSLPDQTRSYPY